MLYIGIDPGQKGGIAIIGENSAIWARMPDTTLDILNYFRAIGGRKHAFLEKAQVMPKQGIRSAFTYGCHYGDLRTALAACNIPYTEITPHTWMTAVGCKGKKGAPKNTIMRAQQLFPETGVKQDGPADALLLAYYCKQELTNG